MTVPESPLDAEFAGLAEALRPLAEPRRLAMLHFLVRPRSTDEVAHRFRIETSAARRDLDELVEAGLAALVQAPAGPPAYASNPSRLFMLADQFGRLGVPEADAEPAAAFRTQIPGRPSGPVAALAGPALIVVHGLTAGAVIPLAGPGPWTIGRDPERTVCLDYDSFVSGRHAELRGRGRDVALADLHSTNGTFVNWHRVPGSGEALLRSGDVIGVGRSLIVFRA